MEYKIINKKQKEYPNRLRYLKDAPEQLYVQGNLQLINKNNIIAIVGSRNCTEYGKNQAFEFARYLSAQDVCVVSGLALGIDSRSS